MCERCGCRAKDCEVAKRQSNICCLSFDERIPGSEHFSKWIFLPDYDTDEYADIGGEG